MALLRWKSSSLAGAFSLKFFLRQAQIYQKAYTKIAVRHPRNF